MSTPLCLAIEAALKALFSFEEEFRKRLKSLKSLFGCLDVQREHFSSANLPNFGGPEIYCTKLMLSRNIFNRKKMKSNFCC